jgi:hypothetical protein
MKKLIPGFILFFSVAAVGQSPYLSIRVKMDPVKTGGVNYKIEMKSCEPVKMTERNSWFSHDTSTIDFASLKAGEIKCDKYFLEGEGVEVLSGDKQYEKYNSFEFGNQVFAWEKIIVFKISNSSSSTRLPEMYIVLPVKYKSFVTSIKLTDVEFRSGKVFFLTDAAAFYGESALSITQSLKGVKDVEVKNFPLNFILEQE